MSEAISNDYVSMINKTGSGYNIPVIVDAIVAAEIVPVKEIFTAKKDKVDAAISGMAVLKSSMQVSQANVQTIMGNAHFSLGVAPDSNNISASMTDQSAIVASSNVLRNLTIAKPFIFEMPGNTSNATPSVGFTSATYPIANSRTLTVELGSYSNTNAFTKVSDAATINVVAGETLTEVAAKLDAISGVSAKIVQKSASGNSFSLVITSETGTEQAISIHDNYTTPGAEVSMFTTALGSTLAPGSSVTADNANAFIQSASDANFQFNGVFVSRETNTVTDLVAGLQINLLSDNYMTDQIIRTSLSQSNIQGNVENLIAELNAYKADLDALGFVDEFGDEDGQLAHNSYLRRTKQKLMNLMTAPITGYGDSNIHFVEFGIKTAVDGSYVFDRTTFDRTYANEPEKFDALTQDKSYASDPRVFVYAAIGSEIPQGKYTFRASDNKLNAGTSGEKTMIKTGSGSGPFSFSTPDYSGFLFQTDTDPPPTATFNIYVARSAQTRLFDFFSDSLANAGNHNTFVEAYKDQSSSLGKKLTKIDQREELLQAMYTKRFSEMEKAVNLSTTSADYITQLVDGWNKS
jgi:flagellar hook-associated protein 2